MARRGEGTQAHRQVDWDGVEPHPTLEKPNYRRPRNTGAAVIFAVSLAKRGETTLVDEIEAFRQALRTTRRERPFHTDGWVVLPDHLHCIWTLPAGDREFSTLGRDQIAFSSIMP